MINKRINREIQRNLRNNDFTGDDGTKVIVKSKLRSF